MLGITSCLLGSFLSKCYCYGEMLVILSQKSSQDASMAKESMFIHAPFHTFPNFFTQQKNVSLTCRMVCVAKVTCV